ncbi:MAG TPA: stage IV sporulation protein A [Firmicutes bacterium]|nr:stage IV sporulation protein A [Bacillota bacterium]
MEFDLFSDLVERTGGDIYLGVVGPVRTGKSTFIRRFMELFVLPKIDDPLELERTRDELPQGSGGKTIMTTEPKFVPDEAIAIMVNDHINLRVRLVDCVGYTVPGASGYEDDEGPRMVSTPWFDYDIPFEEAAELGTRKVITDHSTIGIVVTTDGSIAEIPRESYEEAEERVIEELKELGKPFVILLNAVDPHDAAADALREELSLKYDVPVVALNCLELSQADLDLVLEEALYEFPVLDVSVNVPPWVEVLEPTHWLKDGLDRSVNDNMAAVSRVRDIDGMLEKLMEYEFVESAALQQVNLGTGEAEIRLMTPPGMFEQVLAEYCGEEIDGEADIMRIIRDYSVAKREYDKLAEALYQVSETGYGIVPPALEEMALEEPEIIRQGGRFGVRLRASAPSLHIVKVDVKSEFSPVVGSERQSEELVHYLLAEFEDDPEKLWESQIFGKSLHEMVQDGITGKLGNMPPNAQEKLQETLEKIINEGSGGLIAIIL